MKESLYTLMVRIRVPLSLLVSFCLIANIFCSIVDISFKLGNNIIVSSGNMFDQFGKEQRKTEGDRKIEKDLYIIKVNTKCDAILLHCSGNN